MERIGTAAVGSSGVDRLIASIRDAVALGRVEATCAAVKHALSDLIVAGALRMPDTYRRTCPDTYARRLLHRDPETGFTAVVMTWGPGQGTLLHDHAGIWCVEGVLEGEMEVVQFEMTDSADGSFRFAPRGRVHAVAGNAGALIPPFEYHVLRNALPRETTLTLHVYGGEMELCHLFEENGDGTYRRVEKRLVYHD
jgi:predicted metal-dependent enzyme (double-stranded beta helix superfamily)